jgi:DNA-binding response OmpR family regulator
MLPVMNVLLVADRDIAGFIKEGLRQEGHVVDVSRCRNRAAELVFENDYDAMVTDWWPGAWPLLTLLQYRPRRGGIPQPPNLILTDDPETRGSLESYAEDFLTKPFRFDELVSRINRMVRGEITAPSPARSSR